MAPHAMDGDDIDTETLQSQIDLSMSLVHNLVSSWMKPSQKTVSVSSHTTHKELEEYMRRPPRLGVGAPIPETSAATRETAQLRTQLMNGKKRARDEAEDTEKQSQSSDDGKDSRTAVMQKKVKVDPFSGGKKQRKNQFNGLLTPQHTPRSSQAQISLDVGKAGDEMEIDLDGEAALSASPVQLTTSPRKKKKKRKKTSNADSGAAKLSSPPPTPARGIAHDNHIAASVTRQNVALPSGSVGPEPPQTPVKYALLPNGQAPFATPKAMSSLARVRASQDTLKLPLLNLDGPPPDVSDPEGDDNPSQSGSPKKRRKRRKKKKHSLLNPSPSTGS